MADPQPKQKRELREERLLAEFLALNFPRNEVRTRVRLGFAPLIQGAATVDPQERQILKNFSRWADALVIRPTDLILIEAKILPSPGVVSTLQFYGRLLRGDADFSQFADRPLRLMLVWAFDDPVLARLAQEQGMEVRIFAPPWVGEALKARFPGRELSKTVPTRTPE